MQLTIPADERTLREAEAVLSHGGRLLTVTVDRVAGVRKDGEVRYRRHVTAYLVERGGDCVRLTRDDGTVYTVTPHGCDCPDMQYRGADFVCKHQVAAREVGLLEDVAKSEASA